MQFGPVTEGQVGRKLVELVSQREINAIFCRRWRARAQASGTGLIQGHSRWQGPRLDDRLMRDQQTQIDVTGEWRCNVSQIEVVARLDVNTVGVGVGDVQALVQDRRWIVGSRAITEGQGTNIERAKWAGTIGPLALLLSGRIVAADAADRVFDDDIILVDRNVEPGQPMGLIDEAGDIGVGHFWH